MTSTEPKKESETRSYTIGNAVRDICDSSVAPQAKSRVRTLLERLTASRDEALIDKISMLRMYQAFRDRDGKTEEDPLISRQDVLALIRSSREDI